MHKTHAQNVDLKKRAKALRLRGSYLTLTHHRDTPCSELVEIYEAIFSLRQILVSSRDVQKRKTSESDTKPPEAKRGRWATSTVCVRVFIGTIC